MLYIFLKPLFKNRPWPRTLTGRKKVDSSRKMPALGILILFFLIAWLVSRMLPVALLLVLPAGYFGKVFMPFKYHLFAAFGIFLGVFFSPINFSLIMFGDYLHRPAIYIVIGTALLWTLGGIAQMIVSSIRQNQAKKQADI